MFYEFYKPGKVQILRWLKNPNCYGRKHGAYGIYLDAGETIAFQTAMVVGIKAEHVLYTYIKGVCLDVRNVEYLDTCNKAECAINVGVMYNSVIYHKVEVNAEYLDAESRAERLDIKKVECLDANSNAEYLDVGLNNVVDKSEANRVGGLLRGPSGHNGVGGRVGGEIGMEIMVADIGMMEIKVANIGMRDIKVADTERIDIMVADIEMMDIKIKICSQGTTYGTFPVRTMWVEGAGAFR